MKVQSVSSVLVSREADVLENILIEEIQKEDTSLESAKAVLVENEIDEDEDLDEDFEEDGQKNSI